MNEYHVRIKINISYPAMRAYFIKCANKETRWILCSTGLIMIPLIDVYFSKRQVNN